MLEGIVRESIAKHTTKQLRRDGYLIANIYGKGLENINAAFKVNDFIRTVKAKDELAFDVKIEDKILKVVIQEYQKDPVKTQLLHVDLMIAQPGIRTYYNVPVTVEGTPKGLKNKGMFIYHKRRVRVKSAIENLPKSFHFQIDELDTGDNFLIRDINFPDGVDCYLDPSVPVVGVIKAK
jgi:large subunit ribosomal protein L25